jgi:regulator of sirC expression with transglutaminase-like and TPR domain
VHEAEAAFRQLVADPTAEPPLDEGALLIAAVGSGADVDAGLARLDELAAEARLAAPGAVGLAQHLFVDRGFAGNTHDYGDPRNSFLPDVIDRRLGIPITLSVLLVEVGRRLGIGLHGVGMPGHFIVGIDGEPDGFLDPFHAGAAIDGDGARALFARVQGSDDGFRPAFLAPTPTRQILLRMLANLQQTYVARRQPGARWVAHLRLAFPELPAEERGQAAEVLASVGAFDEAAAVLESMAEGASDDPARDALGRRAVAYRSRSN